MILSVSCSKGDDSQGDDSQPPPNMHYGFNFQGHLDLYIEDSKGNNLLKSKELIVDDIDLIDFKKGESVGFYDPLLDAPRGFIDYGDYVRIALNLPKSSERFSETNLRIKGTIYKLISEWFRYSEIKNENNESIFGGGLIVTKARIGDKVIYQEGDTIISKIIIN